MNDPRHQTIALIDSEHGWIFRLHNENRRVWLDSLSTDAPVPIAFVAGARAAEFEAAIGSCSAEKEMAATARLLLPGAFGVALLDELDAAA